MFPFCCGIQLTKLYDVPRILAGEGRRDAVSNPNPPKLILSFRLRLEMSRIEPESHEPGDHFFTGPAQPRPVQPTSTQHTLTQVDSIPPSFVQFCSVPLSRAQFRSVPLSCAQLRAVPCSSLQLRSGPLISVQFRLAPPSSAQFRSV